jgi:hypothetical protein
MLQINTCFVGLVNLERERNKKMRLDKSGGAEDGNDEAVDYINLVLRLSKW